LFESSSRVPQAPRDAALISHNATGKSSYHLPEVRREGTRNTAWHHDGVNSIGPVDTSIQRCLGNARLEA